MLSETEIDCLACGERTVVSVVAPHSIAPTERRVSNTICRRCRTRLLLVTQSNGELAGCVLDDATGDIDLSDLKPLPSPFDLPDVVRHPVGVSRPRETPVVDIRLRPEWAAALDRELAAAQARPRPLSVPRRVFLSYRWGTPEEDAWVARLHDELVARGNEVVFDRDQMRRPEPPSVPAVVADIASCHVFVAVLDPGYLERIVGDVDVPAVEGWVTDEFNVALALARTGALTLTGLLRDGDRTSTAFPALGSDEAGNTFDVRTDAALRTVLDGRFGQRGDRPDPDVADAAALALHRSHLALGRGEFEEAEGQADRACRLIPELADGHAQRARVATEAGDHDRALENARRALAIDPNLTDMLRLAPGAAAEAGDWPVCAELAGRLLEHGGSDDIGHFTLGVALEELGHVDAAVGHLRLARRAGLQSPLIYLHGGIASLRAGDAAAAIEWFDAGLELVPDSETFHKNAVLAAVAAEEPMVAYERLERFASARPDAADIEVLTQTLVAWLQHDVLPPNLVDLVDRSGMTALFHCDDCQVSVAMPDLNSLLCSRCGVVTPDPTTPCVACQHDGWALPRLGSPCPICGSAETSCREFA